MNTPYNHSTMICSGQLIYTLPHILIHCAKNIQNLFLAIWNIK